MLKFIPTNTTGVIQTFGKFSRLVGPGLTIYIPFIQNLNVVSNRLCEKQCRLTVRTADKVFPELDITLQYRIKHQDTEKAYFELSDPIEQMVSYTDNIVRKASSHMTLDQLFQSHTHIADAIIEEVGPRMKEGGFTIQSAQIRNIMPPTQVLKSMNQINASERRKIAAQNDGEAAKIKAILLAEADAKEKQLRGRGIAQMRANITEGWVESVKDMATKTNTRPKEILQFLVKILQQQTMENMAKYAGTKVIFVDKSTQIEQGVTKQTILQALEAHSAQGNEKKE